MDWTLKTGSMDAQEAQEWLFVLMDNTDKEFKDIRITCPNCGSYHSIFIPCPEGDKNEV